MVSVHLSEGWSAHVVRRPSVVNYSCLDFFYKTVDQNFFETGQKLRYHRPPPSLILVDRKNKMGAPASDWLRHFLILFWNTSNWTEFSETWQEARTLSLLPSLCFLSDRNYFVYDVHNVTYSSHGAPCSAQDLFPWLSTKLKVHISVWSRRG